ncbi:hypothetical protein H8356DRAFT_967078 [Neocallimastix lanati (nom. inval.)]|nr:hypothetical protein H8356DRAFT_967078 [Neocallimastix sp. JGI-2020a]
MVKNLFNNLCLFFNSTIVSKEELDEYARTGFLTDTFIVERSIYLFLFFFISIITVTFLIIFYKLRNSYIIHQRNFGLTFTEGIFISIDLFIIFLPQLTEVPCFLTVISANILNTIINLIFLTRSLRVILFYHYNIFKVTSISKKKYNNPRKENIIHEPNNYLHLLSKKIKIVTALFIIIPSLIAIAVTFLIYLIDSEVRKDCPIWKLEDTMISFKNNKGEKVYIVVIIFGFFFMTFNFIFAILLINVKDVNKYGVKFECLSVSIMTLAFNIINIILQKNATIKSTYFDINENIRRGFLDIYEKTKGGKMFFSFNLMYMFFTSIILPVIHYYRNKLSKNIYFQDPMNSLQYFYKLLNTPSLVSELREIAIKEFSVENVLFWENYQILQKMVNKYYIEYNKAKEFRDERIVTQYDFENYYFQQLQGNNNNSDGSMDNYSYDPNMPIPDEILPYFTSFYYMFIDYNSPDVVNISGTSERQIYNEICFNPTIGVYDSAKNEVVEMMYNSIYPIFLKNNKQSLY